MFANPPLALLLGLLHGCGGGNVPPPPEIVPELPPEEVDEGPDLKCPEGTQQGEKESNAGLEFFCYRETADSTQPEFHGPFRRYFENGERAVDGTWSNGKTNGDWNWWHEDGSKSKKGRYKNGKQVGPWTWWYQNGNRLQEGDYIDGRQVGQWTSYYETGRKKDEGLYLNGAKNGEWKYYEDSEQNHHVRTEIYKSGELVETKDIPIPDPVAPTPGTEPKRQPDQGTEAKKEG